MFPNSVAVKKTALAALKGEWPMAIAVSVIPLAFYLVVINLFSMMEYIFANTFAVAFVRIIFLLVLIFAGLPLGLGSLRVMWGISNNTKLKVGEVFYYFFSFKNYKRVVSFIVLFLGKIILRSVVLLLPTYIIDYISNSASSLFAEKAAPLWVGNIWVFAIFLRIIAVCYIIYSVLRSYLAPFIFISNNNESPFECINKSLSVSRLSVGAFTMLALSLIGWILLSVFFVPMVFTLPYISMCYLVHSRYAAVFHQKNKTTVKGVGIYEN